MANSTVMHAALILAFALAASPTMAAWPHAGSALFPSAAPCKQLNVLGMGLIKEYEGFVGSPSPDPVGLPTVGYGHRCPEKNCEEVQVAFPLSKRSAANLLKDDISHSTACLSEALDSSVSLNDNQWAALTSWVFNEGCAAATSSTLVKRLNAGENPNTVASSELPKWKYVGDVAVPGLVRRRAAEVKLFKTASDRQAFPNCA